MPATARKVSKPRRKTTRRLAANDIRKELHHEMEAIGNTVKKIAHHVKDVSWENGNNAMDQVVHKAQQNPLKTLGIACGVGLLLGLLLKK